MSFATSSHPLLACSVDYHRFPKAQVGPPQHGVADPVIVASSKLLAVEFGARQRVRARAAGAAGRARPRGLAPYGR